MEKIIISFIMCIIFSLSSHAQFTSTYYSDGWGRYSKSNIEDVAYCVEDLSSEYIKTYNDLKTFWKPETSESKKNLLSLYLINVDKAYSNLLAAPPVILDYEYYNLNEEDVKDDSTLTIGQAYFAFEIMNTTPKTIKEITFVFSFKNSDTKVYDIKTGDETLIIKFNNLTGRPICKTYKDYYDIKLTQCYHFLKMEDASYIKPFINKKAKTSVFEKIIIKFNDGSTTTNVARFRGYINKSETLRENGPLSPMVKFLKYFDLKYEEDTNNITD